MKSPKVLARRLAAGQSRPPASHDHEVGYGKPPKHSQFKKGHSGNVKGRPKRQRNVKTIFNELLQEPVQVRQGERTSRVPYAEALLRRIFNGALQGDSKAISAFFLLLRQIEPAADEADSQIAQELTIEDRKLIQNYLQRQAANSQESPP